MPKRNAGANCNFRSQYIWKKISTREAQMKESGEGRERENIDMTGRGERGSLINCLNKFKIVLQKTHQVLAGPSLAYSLSLLQKIWCSFLMKTRNAGKDCNFDHSKMI